MGQPLAKVVFVQNLIFWYVIPPERSWNFDHFEVIIELGDQVELENVKIVRPMKGDSVAPACNTNFESGVSSSNTARTATDEPGQEHQRNSWEGVP